jgi:hypothetical protein
MPKDTITTTYRKEVFRLGLGRLLYQETISVVMP